MLLSEFVYLLRFFCKLRCELIPHILVCELLPRPTLIHQNTKITEIDEEPYAKTLKNQ